MKKLTEGNWDLLRSFTPGEEERNRMRNKIKSSIRTQAGQKEKHRFFEFKNIVLTALFLFISAGLLIQLQKHDPYSDGLSQSHAVNDFSLNWDLQSIYSEKNDDGYAFIKEGSPNPVGMAEFVNDREKNKIIHTRAMNMAKELENFPYPTSMYIEHVKMMDVSLRYHFFVEIGQETMHFSFGYPKLEFAEIYQIMSSLDFNEPKPYRHDEQLYVTHGYGILPYPVGLSPVELNGNTEKYVWEHGSPDQIKEYIKRITSTGAWKLNKAGSSSYTFEAADRSEIVNISINGKEITYEYSYPNSEE